MKVLTTQQTIYYWSMKKVKMLLPPSLLSSYPPPNLSAILPACYPSIFPVTLSSQHPILPASHTPILPVSHPPICLASHPTNLPSYQPLILPPFYSPILAASQSSKHPIWPTSSSWILPLYQPPPLVKHFYRLEFPHQSRLSCFLKVT